MISTEYILSDISEILSGFAWPSNKFNFQNNGIPIIRIQNIDSVNSDFAYFNDDYNDKFLIKEGDILLSLSGSFKLSIWSGPEALLNQRIVKITPRKEVDEKYFFYALQSKLSQIANLGRHALVSNVALSDLRNIKIFLPTAQEQRRIAAILDKAEALRAKRREAIDKLDQLLQSVFLEMFGDTVTNPKNWPMIRLADLISDGPQNGLYKPATEYGKGTPIVRIDGFQCGDLILSNPKNRVNISDADKNKYCIKELDIIINRVNSPSHLGKAALYLNKEEDSVFESNMMRFSLVKEMANPFFINFYLKQKSIKNQILYSKKDASNQSSINQNDVANFIINLPPIEKQNYFVAFFKKVHLQNNKYLLSLSKIDDLIKSMQSRFFK